MDLKRQYATSDNLAARIALHQQCSTNRYPFQRWVFDRLALHAGQRVLEIACGTGSLWRENADRMPEGVSLVLSDISIAMVLTAGGSLVCSLPDLPFADATFDAVIANHMLYHVAERTRGLTEIRRVLRPHGTLFAATNGINHLRELKELMHAFGIEGSDVSASFTLENGAEQLTQVFPSVRCEEYEDALEVTDPEVILAYIDSITPLGERREPMRRAIANAGTFRIAKSTGLFVARDA